MVYCVAVNCRNRSKSNRNIGYHIFPKNPALRKQWISAVRRKDFVPTKYSRVCSQHFLPTDYEKNRDVVVAVGKDKGPDRVKRQLIRGSVPSVFDFTEKARHWTRTPSTVAPERRRKVRTREPCEMTTKGHCDMLKEAEESDINSPSKPNLGSAQQIQIKLKIPDDDQSSSQSTDINIQCNSKILHQRKGNGRKKFKSTEKYEQKINAPVSSSVFPPMAETCQDLGTLSQSWDKDFATKSLQYDVRIQPVKKVCHGLDNPLTQQMLEVSKQHMLGKGEEAQGISQQLTKGSSISVGSAMGEMERISEVETIPLPSELRPIDPVHYANVPLARVSVEIFSLPEVDGYQHLLVLVDYHTKWPEAEALKEKDPLCVAAFLFRQFCQHGGFAINMKEEDEEFVARVYNELHRLTGVAQQVMRNYHSVCNMCRRDCENCCIKKAFVDVLKKYADWPKWIYPVLFALRTTKQEGTGQSPFQLLYNRSPVLWGCSTLTL